MWQIVDIPGKKANKDSSLDTKLKKTDGKIVYFNGFFHNVSEKIDVDTADY